MLFFVLLFNCFFCAAQKNEISIGVEYLNGSTIKHSPKITLQMPKISQGVLFSISHHTKGEKTWQQRMGYPTTSLNLGIINYKNKFLGSAICFFPSIEYDLIKKNRFFWKIKFGGGIGIATKMWNRFPLQDTINNIIGSRLNNFTQVQTNLQYKISDKINLKAGGFFNHISNGSARKPNLGINFSGFTLGLDYFPEGQKKLRLKNKLENEKSKIQFGLRSAFSLVEAAIAEGPFYNVYHQSFLVTKIIQQKNRAFLGVDVTFNERNLAFLKNNAYCPGKEKKGAWNSSVFGGIEFLFGKLGMPIQAGFYTKKMANEGKVWYQKLGMNYYIYENNQTFIKTFYLSTLLKTHLSTADNIEFCVGFLF